MQQRADLNVFSARRAATRSDDDIIDDYDEVTAEHEEEPAPHVKTRATARAVKNSRSPRNHKVVPMKSSSEMEVCVIKPHIMRIQETLLILF